jgi:hypothetical protein
MLNLDTHILLGALADELTRRERELLARTPWSVAAIVPWESSSPPPASRTGFPW